MNDTDAHNVLQVLPINRKAGNGTGNAANTPDLLNNDLFQISEFRCFNIAHGIVQSCYDMGMLYAFDLT